MKHIDKYDLVIILPPPEMKEELLQRIYDRGDTEWYPYLKSIYDNFYEQTVHYPVEGRKIWLKPGQYAGEIIEKLEQENLD